MNSNSIPPRSRFRGWIRRELPRILGFTVSITAVSLTQSQDTPPILTAVQEGVLTSDESPYEIAGDVFVPHGKTLTIEPGVEIRFRDPFSALIVDGTLSAVGTADKPIVFTSDEGAEDKAPGQWEGTRSMG